MIKRITALALIALSANCAIAKEDSKYYVKGNLGYAYNKMDAKDSGVGGYVSKSGSDGSLLYGVAFGYEFNNYIRSEIELFTGSEASMSSSGASLKVKPFTGLINFAVQYDNKSLIKPYLTMGLGTSRMKFSSGDASENKTLFAYAAGVGARVAATDSVDLDLNVRYIGYTQYRDKSAGSTFRIKVAQVVPMLGVAIKF